METRLTIIGVAMVIGGVFVLLAPIASAPSTSLEVVSGTSIEIDVPRSASFTGASVLVELNWGVRPACFGFCGPVSYNPVRSYVTVFDCGTSPCRIGQNYSSTGATDPAYIGSADFSASPGHDYQVWAFYSGVGSPYPYGPIPLTYTLVGPPFGGYLGILFMALGGVMIVHSIRPLNTLRHRTSKRPARD